MNFHAFRWLSRFSWWSLLVAPSLLLSQEAAVPSGPPPEAEVAQPDFVRYVMDGEKEELQTAAVRYEKEGKVVDLISVVHLADKEYYDELNTQLEKYDAVLYEMVGGEFQGRGERAVASEMGAIQAAQSIVQKMLGMDFQADRIDYELENFVHADIDWEEYEALMTSRGQSLGTIFQRAMEQSQTGMLPGIPTDEKAAQQMMTQLMSSLTSGNTADLKRVMAPVLGESEAMITQLEGDDGTVIVTERNKVVMKVLTEEMKKGNRSLAIFYGAGHMPDLEKRLLAAGFKRTDESWMTAWTIKDTPPEERVNLMQEIFSDPETIQALMGAAQEIMREMQEANEAGVE